MKKIFLGLFVVIFLLMPVILTLGAGEESQVTLGSSKFFAPLSRGFGTVRPKEIFNGGDPSGLVTNINWVSWGGAQATGHGLSAIFKPGGGYYGTPVRIDLIARDEGTCPGVSHPADRQLFAREPSRPRGKPGKWFLWAGANDLCAASP